MGKYRKKPVVIEAHQWFNNGDHPEDRVGKLDYDPITNDEYEILEGRVVRFYNHPNIGGKSKCMKCSNIMQDHGWIDTLEGGHIVCPGDFIITGIKGEKYPCKSDIFEETYEKV